MSMTNGYDIKFNLTGDLKSYMDSIGIGTVGGAVDASNQGGLIEMLCDEAQLPNVQAATGQLSGRVLGENQVNYAYAKFYSDLSLTWMCDADMTPLKFVTAWHGFIFSGEGGDDDRPVKGPTGLTGMLSQAPLSSSRAIRLNYPEKYLCPTMRITKTEKNAGAPNGRAPISYILENAFPYSVDAVPLSYGTSQITKVTANFYYEKHTVVFGNGK